MRAFCFALLLLPASASAEASPSKAIRLVLPYGAGGVADITARTVAPKMSEGLGQPLVIENKPSAGGIVAAQEVARAAPDGHTLLLINNGNAVSTALFKSLPYDPEKDFAMISTLGFFPLVILTDPKSGLKSVAEAIAEAKKSPGRMNLASIGIGSTQHLGAELFKSTAGIDVQIIPYKSTGEVVTATKSGDASLAFEFMAPAMSHIKSGNLRALAVTTGRRFPALAEVPTVTESGLPGYDVASWNGLAAPARSPPAGIDRLHQKLRKGLAPPDARNAFG